MNVSEIRNLDKAGIVKKIDELRVELFNNKFKKHTSGIEKPHVLKGIRKDIARLKTVLNEKKNG
jgi:large subunit ribosomal protein L29